MIGRRFILATSAALPFLADARRSAEAVPVPAPIPAALRPAGFKELFTARASGVQIYTSVIEAGGSARWAFEQPLARLVDRHGRFVVYHYAGPSVDGSKIVRDKDTPVQSTPAPNATADIPWLLVKVIADPAVGMLQNVGYVQRIDTRGGVAPARPPARADTSVGVSYTATYGFFTRS